MAERKPARRPTTISPASVSLKSHSREPGLAGPAGGPWYPPLTSGCANGIYIYILYIYTYNIIIHIYYIYIYMYIYSMSFPRRCSREAITDMASTSSSSFFWAEDLQIVDLKGFLKGWNMSTSSLADDWWLNDSDRARVAANGKLLSSSSVVVRVKCF